MDNYDKAVEFVSDTIDGDELIELAKETADRFGLDIKVVIQEMVLPEIESILGELI